MRRRAVLLVALAALMAMASPALADNTENLNHPSYWGDDCYKISGDFDGARYWVAHHDYRLVVVKGGPTRVVYEGVEAGDELYAPINPNRKRLAYYGVSHVIKCRGGYDDPYDPPGYDDPYVPPPSDDPEIPEFPNRPRSWGDSCLKLEGDFDAKYWVADANYDLVVVKGGPTRVVYEDVSEGDLLYAPVNPNRKRLAYYGVSHVIMCGGYDDPYEPPPPPDDPYGG